MTWDGVEHRHNPATECIQENRLERIEQVADGTVKQLVTLSENLIEIKTILKGKIEKYDDHVVSGEEWRKTITMLLISAFLTGGGATLGFGIWVGQLAKQIEINTGKFLTVEQKLDFVWTHSYGVQRALGKDIQIPENK